LVDKLYIPYKIYVIGLIRQ